MSGLREFIDEQERAGRVTRVTDALDPVGEAGAALAAGEAGGRIVILEQVRGHATPVVGGLVAGRELMAAAIGAAPDEAVSRLAAAMDAPAPVRVVGSAPFLDG